MYVCMYVPDLGGALERTRTVLGTGLLREQVQVVHRCFLRAEVMRLRRDKRHDRTRNNEFCIYSIEA